MRGRTGNESETGEGTNLEEIIVEQHDKIECYDCGAAIYVLGGLLNDPADIDCWSCGETVGETRAVGEFPAVWRNATDGA